MGALSGGRSRDPIRPRLRPRHRRRGGLGARAGRGGQAGARRGRHGRGRRSGAPARQPPAAAHRRHRRGAAAAARAHRRLEGDRAEGPGDRQDGDHGRRRARRRCGCPTSRSTRAEATPLAHMAFNDDVVAALSAALRPARRRRASPPRSPSGGRAGAAPRSASPTAGRSRRGSRSPPTGRARSCGRSPTFPPSAGTTTRPASSRPSRTNTTTRACAEQHFLPAGPFAILPLPGRQSSIVWNERRADARALVALDPDDFVRQLEYRFTPKLGAIRLASRVEAFPFRFQVARRFVARAAGARRRRRARRASDRRPGPQPRPAGRGGARRDDRRRDAARPRSGRGRAARRLSAGAAVRRRRRAAWAWT